MDQVNKMAFALADLRSSLDVYKGLFHNEEDVKIIRSQFQEISLVLQKSLSVKLIIGCAALFTDPPASFRRDNMSFKNLYCKHSNKLSDDAHLLFEDIRHTAESVDLKNFRNRHVGHFDLDEKLSDEWSPKKITTHDLENLINSGERLLNLIIRDAKLRPAGHVLEYCNQIPESRSTKLFLDRFRPV